MVSFALLKEKGMECDIGIEICDLNIPRSIAKLKSGAHIFCAAPL